MEVLSASRKRLTHIGVAGAAGSLLGLSTYALLRGEAAAARRSIGVIENAAPPASGWYGQRKPGAAFEVALFGDSLAAGYGVPRVIDTPGAILATELARVSERRVHLREYCRVGADSSDLARQVYGALHRNETAPRIDVAIIIIGGNDVTHAMRSELAADLLREAVEQLQQAGATVIVGTCPDLGTVRPIAPPLRQVLRAWSRRLARAQTEAVQAVGGRTVALATVLGPEFAASPAEMFGPDRYHPSVRGYRAMAEVITPSLLEATVPLRTERIRSGRMARRMA